MTAQTEQAEKTTERRKETKKEEKKEERLGFQAGSCSQRPKVLGQVFPAADSPPAPPELCV